MANQNLQGFLQSRVLTAYLYSINTDTSTYIRCLADGLLNSCRMAAVEVKMPVVIYRKLLYKIARSFVTVLGLSKRSNKNLKLQKL